MPVEHCVGVDRAVRVAAVGTLARWVHGGGETLPAHQCIAGFNSNSGARETARAHDRQARQTQVAGRPQLSSSSEALRLHKAQHREDADEHLKDHERERDAVDDLV